jgi:hypothetical protein
MGSPTNLQGQMRHLFLMGRELEMSVLEECFAFDVRRGLVAASLWLAYTCFPPETRRSDFLKLVDVFYNIDYKIIL